MLIYAKQFQKLYHLPSFVCRPPTKTLPNDFVPNPSSKREISQLTHNTERQRTLKDSWDDHFERFMGQSL